MNLDLASVLVMTALVVAVSSIVFIAETVIRRDDGVGRVWAVAFLAAPVALLAYLVWAYDRSAWWAIAVGNAAFVTTISAIWLGCRRYNARASRAAAAAAGVAAVVTAVMVVVAGPQGGDWAGARTMFTLLAVFSTLGCVECLRGALRASRTAWALAVVLGLYGVYCVVRLVVFSVEGPNGPFFQMWLSTIPSSFVTVTFTIVSLVAASVLRAGRTPVRGLQEMDAARGRAAREMARATGADSGVLVAEQFWIALQGLLTRAQWHDELVAVLAVRIDDLAQISQAFGSEAAQEVAQAWRRGVRHSAPAAARVGEDGQGLLLVTSVVGSAAEARRLAVRISRGVFEQLQAVPGAILPAVGVGVALSDTQGPDVDRLVSAARAASLGGEAVSDTADGFDPPRL
ncbi:diguanylate cyclase domain-containing protein [Microbacterium protaetiae]|nr:diguanylate cyclase [Microbacterium protaetiae]